jgi:hypothetical protein
MLTCPSPGSDPVKIPLPAANSSSNLIVSCCDGNQCTLVIPSLPSTDPNAMLVLMSPVKASPDSPWRRHSFTMYDRGEQDVKISIIPEDGRRLITVNGIPRTVVPSLQLVKYDSNWNRYYEDAPEGNYYLCWWIEEKVGGYCEIRPDGGSCYHTREGNIPQFNCSSLGCRRHKTLTRRKFNRKNCLLMP